MNKLNQASAGTLESCDIHITLIPEQHCENHIELESPLSRKYGKAIRQVITDCLIKAEITGVTIKAIDRGALDHVIAARMQTVLRRALCQEVSPS
jgi:citrate lyase subunit gamma (acyl carrier protein)